MSFELPDDPSQLAVIVMTGTSEEQRNQAMTKLVPIVMRIARQKARGRRHEHWRQELIDESPSIIWSKLQQQAYDKARGPFEGWCGRVLKNGIIDRIRSRRRDRLGQAVPIDPATGSDPADPRAGWEQVASAVDPLGKADLDRIERWEPRDRIVLLCLSGLWLRVSPETWGRWLADCDLDEPFPPEGFLHLENTSQRYDVLAPALSLSRNALAQRRRRGKRALWQLDALAEWKEGRS